MPISKFAWIQRARMQFAKRTQDYAYDWQETAEVCYDEMYADFKDDPEGAADEDMSYWD